MTLLIESIILCILFAFSVTSSLLKNPLAWISDYPTEIQQRAKELGLVPKDKKYMTKAELARKTFGVIFIIILFIVLLINVNGAETFGQGFFQSFLLYNSITWFDAFIVDCMWFCHSKKVIIPGTEDMTENYHDYMFHIKNSFIGMAIGLPVCIIIGAGVMIFA